MTTYLKPTKYYMEGSQFILDVSNDRHIHIDDIINKDQSKIIEIDILYRGISKQYLYTITISDTKTSNLNIGTKFYQVIHSTWNNRITKEIILKTVHKYSKKYHEELYYNLNDQKMHDLIEMVSNPKDFNY